MGKYFAKRLGMAILTIFLVACLTFLLMNAVPGSPWLSEKTPSETTLAALNAKYGLDKPVYVQLFMYLKNILHGDFGVSLKMQKNRAVLDIIVDMFPVSAKVGALALAWAILVGVPHSSCDLYTWNLHAKLRCGICSSGNPDWKQCTESVSVYF